MMLSLICLQGIGSHMLPFLQPNKDLSKSPIDFINAKGCKSFSKSDPSCKV